MLGYHEILGHEQIKEHFQNAVTGKRISHAYILSGEAGMGKKMLADILALSLHCEAGESEPCMVCHGCRQTISGNHPDLIYMTHEKPASIGVDDIRKQINDTIMIRPYSSHYKVYIVDEAEKMTVQAQNALLKTIEEPPAYAVILLLSTNQNHFLPTITSRCVQLKLKPLPDQVVKKHLIDSCGASEDAAEIYTALARGNLGKAISLVSSEEFKVMFQKMLCLLKEIYETNITQLLDDIRRLKEDNLDLQECLDFMQLWYRDVLLYKVTRDINLLVFKEEYKAIGRCGERSTYNGIEKILEAIDKARSRLNANVNMELVMELMLLAIKEN